MCQMQNLIEIKINGKLPGKGRQQRPCEMGDV